MKKPLLLLSALLLSACVSSPTTTPQIKQVDAATLGLGPDTAPKFPDDWWKAFGDPQIDRLAMAMMTGNPTLQSALARIRAAQADLSSQQTQDYPQASLEGQEQRELFSKDFIIPPPYGGTWRWMGTLEGNLSWNLDFWGKQADLITKAKNTSDAVALDAQAARLALSGALAQTYINLWLAYQMGDIADRTVADRSQILTLTQNRFNSGLENPQSLEQAKALLDLAKIDQMRLAAQREMDVHAIAALTGQGASAYGAITRPMPALDTALPLPATLPADLLARRPDVMAARARIDAAAAGREAAHAEFYPDINLTAFAGFQAIGLANLLTGNALTVGAGPAIHLPIFDAGKIRAQYAGATAALDMAVADYNGAVLNAIKQAADAMTQVKSLGDQRIQQQAALDAAEKSFAYAQTRYRTGLSDQIVMLNAESTLLNARQQMAGLAANMAAQRITLLLSVGGGFNPISNDVSTASKDAAP